MKGFPITFDRDVEITAKIRVDVDPKGKKQHLIARVTATCDRFVTTFTGGTGIMYTLPADKMVDLQISYVDKNGNPAAIDGNVTWDSSDEEIAFTESADPTGATVTLKPGPKIGNCQITATADADLGEGVRTLVTPFDVTVVGGEAVAGTIAPTGEQQPLP